MSRVTGKAVVLLSGGLDSATTLAVARDEGFECSALSFDYGQRHRFELEAARKVAQALGAIEHKIITIDLHAIGGSALTDDLDVPKDRPVDSAADEIPITYVPARNTIFLSFALAYAETIGSKDIFIGVNAIDYSGYPDCRPAYIGAFEEMANLGTKMGVEGRRIRIHTPLIDLTKAQIIKRGIELGVDYGLTHSCYDPDPETGRPCGRCDSCLLRVAGFREAGIQDPSGGGVV
ncbi:MAG: 7-cyano-7-deazaguanine synthase QueC [Phycisphaerales bacterium]|nr:MAG: 7-cyano-7-deazaguanine synthase QueC [Phycisphaerales bacterium]